MADYDSSLPVRTETNGDVAAKIVDGTIPSQTLTVEADGSINVNDNGGSITVDATNLDIRDLVFATDKVDVSGSEVSLDAATLAALETITVVSTNLDIRDLAFATDKVDVTGSEVSLDATTLAALESITVQNGAGASAVNIQDGGNSITVDATNLDIRDLTHVSDSIKVGDGTDFLAINTDGSINVVVQEDVGTEVVNYDTSAAIAGGASDNHDLVFASASKLYQVWAAASGKLKMEVQIETGSATDVFNTIGVGFNSTADANIDFTLAKHATIPAGARVRVIRTNRDNQTQDVYSTIIAILG